MLRTHANTTPPMSRKVYDSLYQQMSNAMKNLAQRKLQPLCDGIHGNSDDAYKHRTFTVIKETGESYELFRLLFNSRIFQFSPTTGVSGTVE